ncbi:TonB-dependent receptor [Caulobacter mirabilis]|uniref:TonB-dependent receptor n=1 Tax=Caulobacter mirabilis TaxID=69666 RepID=A0A2D2B2W6_9CAUL|nr:TonB-dependent receptor [Caulobacter mirabilis]ATQ44577.1 TonB-dependent receptor [Caulobacter mirabilis]
MILTLFSGALLLAVAGPALAAPKRTAYDIDPKPLPEALIDLAVQADISILGTDACRRGDRRGLRGRYTLDEALQHLLAGAPCSYRIVDAHTVALSARQAPQIFAVAPPGRRKAPPPEPPPPAPSPTFEIEELVVHSAKREVTLGELSAAASILAGRGIAAMGAVDVTGTTGQLTGLHMTNLGPGRDKLLIRGLSDGAFTGRARSTVATFLDDLPINYSAPHPDLRFVDVKQIEVLRGPQGSLYGAGAISGVYRIVTNKPDLENEGGSLAVFGSVTKGGAPSGAVEGWFNVPVVPDRLAMRVVAYHERLGGYLDDVNMRRSNVDRTTRSGGRVSMRVELSDTFHLDLSTTGQQLDTNDTKYTTQILSPGKRANRVQETHRNDFFQTALSLHGEFKGVRFRSSTGFIRHDYASQYDASAILDPADEFDLGVYRERARVDLAVQDTSFSVSNPTGLSWLLGIYGSRSRERSPSELHLRSRSVVVPVYVEDRRDTMRELAIYGEMSYRLSNGWSVAAGARAFETSIDTEALIDAPQISQQRPFSAKSRTSGVSPKVSVQYEFPSGGMIYALFSEGYRAAGANSSGLRTPLSYVKFDADHLQNFEIGAKLRLADGRLRLTGAIFHDLWTDIQTDGFLGSGLALTANAGDARVTGLELEGAHDWDSGLSMRANVTFSDSELTRANRGFTSSLGRGLPGVPEITGGVLITYRRQLGDGLELQLVGEASYVGSSRISFDPRFAPSSNAYIRDRIGADLSAGRWRFGAFVSNITDASGDTFAYGNPFSFGQVRQTTPQRPRTFGLRLSADF